MMLPVFIKNNSGEEVLGRLGGGYLGVGADQNYTLAAVAQAELIFLVDIDAEVIRWHKIYAALIPLAESSQALGMLFHPRAEATVRHALESRWGSESVELWQSYRAYRGMISAHLGRERQISRNGRAATWLSDPVLYGRIRELMTARRVIARVGDLHGERTLLGHRENPRRLVADDDVPVFMQNFKTLGLIFFGNDWLHNKTREALTLSSAKRFQPRRSSPAPSGLSSNRNGRLLFHPYRRGIC